MYAPMATKFIGKQCWISLYSIWGGYYWIRDDDNKRKRAVVEVLYASQRYGLKIKFRNGKTKNIRMGDVGMIKEVKR